jgi:hypothetical protein
MKIFEQVAEALTARGFDASVWDSGGNVECVLVRYGGKVYVFGDSGDTWGADCYESEEAFENWNDGYMGKEVNTIVPTSELNADHIAVEIAYVLETSTELGIATAKFKEAQHEFIQAAAKLALTWERDALAGKFTDGYPFPNSFDEVLMDLLAWRDKSFRTKP